MRRQTNLPAEDTAGRIFPIFFFWALTLEAAVGMAAKEHKDRIFCC